MKAFASRVAKWAASPDGQRTIHRVATVALTLWTSLKAGGVV